MIFIQHPIADFEAWKKAFDSDPIGRARNGVTGYRIFRPADDLHYILVSLEFSSLEEAQEFLPKLRELWKRAGDKLGFGGPEGVQVRILDEVERVVF